MIEVPTKIPAMGKSCCAFSTPTQIEARAPAAICKKPNRAAALPAFDPNGAIERAAELGFESPIQHKKIKIVPTTL